MPRPSRRGEILDAALHCFATHGRDGTRVRHIAEQAGVSEAAIYRHFASLEAVAEAVFVAHMTSYGRTLHAIVGAPDRSVRERLEAFVETTLDLCRDRPEVFAFLVDQQPQRMAALPADASYPLHAIELLVAEGQADGSVVAGDVRLLAAMVLGCTLRPTIVARHAAPGRSPDLDAAAARRTIARGAWAVVSGER